MLTGLKWLPSPGPGLRQGKQAQGPQAARLPSSPVRHCCWCIGSMPPQPRSECHARQLRAAGQLLAAACSPAVPSSRRFTGN